MVDFQCNRCYYIVALFTYLIRHFIIYNSIPHNQKGEYHTKKLISILLSLCLLYTMVSPATAAEISSAPTCSSTTALDDGFMYTAITHSRKVAILTNGDGSLIDISISYLSSPNTVYQWTIEDYLDTAFVVSNDFWNGIVDYVENRMASANMITVTEEIYDEPIEVSSTRSSAGADLIEDMVELLGTDEYALRLIHTVDYGYMHLDIYETLDIRIFTAGVKSWSTAINVSSLIVTIIDAVPTTPMITGLCTLFGVVVGVNSLIPAGSINKYLCRGMHFRDVTINDSAYSYAMADMYIDYYGYENADINSRERAFVDSSSYSATFIPDRITYFSYAYLINAAYNEYKRIGQQD